MHVVLPCSALGYFRLGTLIKTKLSLALCLPARSWCSGSPPARCPSR